MGYDIFVGIMIVIALGAGVWCRWFENFGSNREKEKRSDAVKENGGKKSDFT